MCGIPLREENKGEKGKNVLPEICFLPSCPFSVLHGAFASSFQPSLMSLASQSSFFCNFFYVRVISIFIDQWFWAYAVLAERSLLNLELPMSCSDDFLGYCAVVGFFTLQSMNAVWFWSVFLKLGFNAPSLINTTSCFFLVSQHCSKCKTEKVFDADSDNLLCAL